jgi:plastocyanin
MKKLISRPRSQGKPTRLSAQCRLRTGAAVIVSLLFSSAVFAADFNVTSPGFFYTINANQPNPRITVVRGQTYTFAINTSSDHPFFINSPGVQNNNITEGTITYTVPTAGSNYNYFCTIHGFGAQIITVAAASAPPPPTIRILSLAVSNTVVLRSTGTNGWSVNPEYSTNLTGTNWFALAILSNSFQNGVNETFCGRPPGTNVFFRVRSQPN